MHRPRRTRRSKLYANYGAACGRPSLFPPTATPAQARSTRRSSGGTVKTGAAPRCRQEMRVKTDQPAGAKSALKRALEELDAEARAELDRYRQKLPAWIGVLFVPERVRRREGRIHWFSRERIPRDEAVPMVMGYKPRFTAIVVDLDRLDPAACYAMRYWMAERRRRLAVERNNPDAQRAAKGLLRWRPRIRLRSATVPATSCRPTSNATPQGRHNRADGKATLKPSGRTIQICRATRSPGWSKGGCNFPNKRAASRAESAETNAAKG